MMMMMMMMTCFSSYRDEMEDILIKVEALLQQFLPPALSEKLSLLDEKGQELAGEWMIMDNGCS